VKNLSVRTVPSSRFKKEITDIINEIAIAKEARIPINGRGSFLPANPFTRKPIKGARTIHLNNGKITFSI
jgi:hypothetical protein